MCILRSVKFEQFLRYLTDSDFYAVDWAEA